MSALSILAEECELLNDSKYRSYITQVEKALKSFEYTSEWADLISALGKLNKVLLAHVKYPVIPKRVTIGKRLAQCLHPALPGGVHLKALETYDIILKCIGTQRLAQDLFIYSAGLFPLLGFAAMNVKPVLLSLFERHFVALGKHIKPGLNGMLLGLLPGLEEGSEYHERTNALLEDFMEATEPEYFFTCLWECILSCPSARLSAISFLLSHFNKKKTMEDQIYMMGVNIDLMVEALCQTSQDSVVLVQRSMLDFLLLAFPMHNKQLTRCDMAKIMKHVIKVVLRRDMSLNRRLYTWLLGTGANASNQHQTEKLKRQSSASSEGELGYFFTYSKDLLIEALKSKLDNPQDDEDFNAQSDNRLEVLKPFRILISLLDKPEIGPIILENLLLPVFQCLHRECKQVHPNESVTDTENTLKSEKDRKSDDAKHYYELIKTANLLFGTFEPYFIWDFIGRAYEKACVSAVNKDNLQSQVTDTPTISELCTLVGYLLDIISLGTFLETQTEHLPEMLLRIITNLSNHCIKMKEEDVKASLQLCSKLLAKVQPAMDTLETDGTTSLMDEVIDEEYVEIKGNEETLGELNTGKQNKTDDQSLKGSSANDSGKPVKKYNRQSSQSSFGKDSGRKNSKSHTAMQSCIDSYKSFFHTFLVDKFFAEGCSIEKYFQTLCTIQAPYTYYTDDDSLIDSDSVYSCDLDDSKAEDQDGKPCKKEELIVGKSASVIENFNLACSLLLDFSSFPIYCTDLHKILQRSTSSDTSLTLPAWLQDLMVCCCFAGCYEIQSTAISTMLDLITMTRSIQSASDIQHDLESRPGRAYCINEGLVSVLIVPALLPFQLKYIGERTTFFRRTCQILWDFLDLHTPLYHEKSVDLLYQLHQAAPSAWVCEDVIGKALVSDTQEKQIAAFQKFTVLWHLGRDIKLDHAPGCVPKTFDRSLFVFLDSLKEDSSPTKTIVSTWLTHIIQRGDISRVLTPLLMMLLHPDTARVSVQHINVHKPEKIELGESDEDIRKSEARIIAISSDGGHVIYHLNPDERFSAKSEEELKAYAFTSVNKYGATETAPVTKPLIDDEHHYEKVQAKDLSLTMNPFGSQNSLDKIIYDGFEPPFVRPANLTGAKRLDKETCAKEGIVFDDSESNPSLFSDSSPLEESPEHFVRELLMGIVNQVVPLEMESYSSADADEELHASIKAKIGDNAMTEGGIGNASSYHLSEDQEILNSIDSKGMQVDSPTNSELDLAQADKEGEEQQSMDIHPLHLHMLLYTQKYDFRRTMYALSTLKSMLVTCPRLVVTSLVTSSISGSRTQQLAKLQILLGRHRKSVFGKDFYGEVPPEAISSYRSNMFIEIIISICLYLVRSYYPNLMISKLSAEELQGNKEVHILSTEVLTLLTSELIRIMKESGKSFASYIKDLLNRCKLQKALLHCCLASVYNMSRQTNSSNKITEAIVAFNENNLDPSFTETFQIKLLNLLLVMIMLEDRMERNHGESHDLSTGTTQSDLPKIRNNFQQYLLNAKYLGTSPIVHQSMFLSCILSAMKQMHMRHAHRHWIAMVTSSLPYMGKTLSAIVINVIAQLCRNLELVAVQYEDPTKFREGEQVPCDHLLTMLEGMTTICHYCLLDTASPVSVGLPAPTSNSITTDTGSAGQILNNLIHVFNPINSGKESSPQRELGPLSPVMDARRSLLSIMPRIIACLLALWKAANAVEAKIKYKKPSPSSIMGEPKLVKQKILEFLSPVSLPHGNHMLGAVGVAWNDRRKNATSTYKKFNMPPCEDQLLLVELVSSIKVLPTDTLVQTVKQVLKQPPPTDLAKFKKSIPLEVNMLQFFYAYVKQTTSSQLVDSWPSLLSLLRESLQIILLPPGKFILVQILNEFVQKMPSFEDKKNQRDLQDITQKLLEAVSLIAGSSLEQTTWLRRNLAVKPGPQNEKLDLDDDELGEDGTSMVEIKQRKATMDSKQPNASDSKYSVHALSILAEYTSPLLDVVYGSDEKDKVPPILTTLLYSVFPYLRTHSSNNLPSYRACSQILASISSFQYTRKSWRKEALELLLDNGFFMMDLQCLQFWKCIIDNLMTHDKTTFKDLMSRVSITQSASLNLFSSKEQELEQRAQMLKRLAFTLYCSEPDQYQKSMPDIQERLAESLRMPHQVPSVMSQVFLCFRVLILRMSSHHLTSLWPTVITEMVHVFMQIEQELSSDTDEYTWHEPIPESGIFEDVDRFIHNLIHKKTQIQRIAALDSSWAHLGNGLNAHNNPSWLQLYLSVCKLLDMALALPADVVPQFQLYRWAFIGGSVEQEAKGISPEEKKEEAKRRIQRAPSFTPHIVRLAKLINQKIKGPTPIMKQVSGRPMLTQPYMKSLAELQPFFNTLCNSKHTDNSIMITNHPGNFQGVNHQLNISKQTMAKSVSTPEFTKSRYLQQTMSSLAQGMPSSSKSNREYIEELVERDFLEPMSA